MHPQVNGFWISQMLVAFGLFALLWGWLSCSSWLTNHEERLQHRITLVHTGWWWQAIAVVFDPKLLVVWDGLLAILLAIMGCWARAIWVLVALGSLDVTGILIKHQVHRHRPTDTHQAKMTYSFPSGHTLGTTLMVLMIRMLFNNSPIHWLTGLCWLAVVISRLTLRAHYPSDVLGAVLLAYGWFIGTELLYLLIMR